MNFDFVKNLARSKIQNLRSQKAFQFVLRSLVDWLVLLFDDFAGFDGNHTRCTTARVTSKAKTQERKKIRVQKCKDSKADSVAMSYTKRLRGTEI